MKSFHLDIITPTNTYTYEDVNYLRLPTLNGLIGIKARHAEAIIALDIGEIKIVINGKEQLFSTSGGFSDIKPEGVQLLLETVENIDSIDQNRAKDALDRAEKRLQNKTENQKRALQAIKRAKNRLTIAKKI